LLQELPELTLAEAPVMRGFAFRRPERVVLKWSPTATR